jgi:hypothetical protein
MNQFTGYSWYKAELVILGRRLDRSHMPILLVRSAFIVSPRFMTECVYAGVGIVTHARNAFREAIFVLLRSMRVKDGDVQEGMLTSSYCVQRPIETGEVSCCAYISGSLLTQPLIDN